MALEPQGVDSWFERMTAQHGGLEIGGEWIDRPWDLVAKNADHLAARLRRSTGKVGVSNRHLATLALGRAGRPALRSTRPPGSIPTPSSTRPTGRSSLGAERLGPAVHPDRGPVLDRPRHPALPRQPPRLRDDRPELPDRRRGRGVDRPRHSRTSITRASWATPTSASGSTWARSPPTATCATTTARSTSRSRATRSRPARPRSAASSATTRGPAWGACSTRARRSA